MITPRAATIRPATAILWGVFVVAVVVALAASEPAARASEATEAPARPLQFARDVVPALTRAGCNAGACHGAFQGRGGFRLSLLGFDPNADYQAMFEQSRGRRVFAASPSNSLLLLKATATLPHGGGRRLLPDSPTYRILHDYIAQGAPAIRPDEPTVVALEVTPHDITLEPGQRVNLRVSALWSDGTERDVTQWALFDSRDSGAVEASPDGVVTARRSCKSAVSVRYAGRVASVAIATPFGPPATFDFRASNYIDELTATEWRRLGLTPAPLSSDEEFVRRVYLDLIGTLPTPDEVRRFLAAPPAIDKRAMLIDELLTRPEYADYWSVKWGDLLRVHRRYVGDKGLGSFAGWVRRSVRQNKPLDRMARELLTAEGNLFTNGPVAYYFVDQKPEELAETTAQLFLGVRLQCAQCHHHPFEAWGQADYYGLAAFFTRLEVRDNGEKGRFGGMQLLRAVPQETRPLNVVASPRVLGAESPAAPDNAPGAGGGGDPRQALADWVVSPENPYFARNFANRFWSYMTGRGLVEPVDDLRATNPPTNPALLDALAADLATHGFDAKHLLRRICNSRTYQLASRRAAEQDRDGSLFTHRVPRRLAAEVMLDAVNRVTGHVEAFDGAPPGTRAIALNDPAVPSEFLMTFGRPQRNNTCECARVSSPDLLQALHLMNNAALQGKIAAPTGRLGRLLGEGAAAAAGAAAKDDAAVAEELYLAALSRRPLDWELKAVREIVADAPSPKEGWEDVLWALLNGPEFAFSH